MVADWLRVADIIDDSIVDGPGLRLTVFTQGCPRRCKGCHNPGTHDPAGGRIMPIEEIWEQYRDNPLLSGITFSGGEPFLQPEPLSNLARLVHASGGDVIDYCFHALHEVVSMPVVTVMNEKPDTDSQCYTFVGVLEIMSGA